MTPLGFPLTGVARQFLGRGPVLVRFTGIVTGNVIAELDSNWYMATWKSSHIHTSSLGLVSEDGIFLDGIEPAELICRVFERNGGALQAGVAALQAQDADRTKRILECGMIGIRNQNVEILEHELALDS